MENAKNAEIEEEKQKNIIEGIKLFKLIKINNFNKCKLSKRFDFKNMGCYINYIKLMVNKIIFLLKTLFEYLILAIPFILMDYFIRVEAEQIRFKVLKKYSYIYSCSFISFFVLSSKCLKGNIGKIYYSVLFIFHFLLYLTNIIFFSFTSTFFMFKIISFAGEGSHYMFDVILDMKFKTWRNVALIIFSFILAFFVFRKTNKFNFHNLFVIFGLFILIQNMVKNLFAPIRNKRWNDFKKISNIVNEFSNSNKCMKIVGFYKFVQTDFYNTYLNFDIFLGKESKEELEFLKKIYKDTKMHSDNEYTGIFKNKNIILIQLEGFEHFLINEEYTPTLYSLKNNSFDFTAHYSYKIDAGQTFNSEFCVNTGFVTPFTIKSNSFDLNKNTFNSLPKIFKKLGYTSKGFHFNYPEFYSRDVNYLGWGYDKFLSLMKTKTKYKNAEQAGQDTELINNKEFYDEIFNTKGNFLYYFVTYSIHWPYNNKKGYHTNYVLKKKFGKNIPAFMPPDEVAKNLAEEVDRMVKLLLEGLKSHNLLDNTVLVFFSDHTAGGFNKRILSKYKITTDQRINHTPFFIWSSNIKGKTIDKTNSQLDILPTILNLFGVPFLEKVVIGRDIFDKDYSGIAYFSDYSWIDGNILFNNGNITKLKDNNSNNQTDNKYISKKSKEVKLRLKQNDLTLKYDYLKNILKK